MVDVTGMLRRLPSRESILAAIDRLPAARQAVSPFVPGETAASAVAAVHDVLASGMSASVAYLPPAEAGGTALLAHMQAIEALDSDGVADGTDLTVDLVALGLGSATHESVVADAAALCAAAAKVGMTVTFAGLAHDALDPALSVHRELLARFPDVGMTIAANLHRSEADCLDLASSGARVRLIKREADEPVSVAFTRANEVDKAYVRCVRILMAAGARTIVATHDARLIEIAAALAERSDREPGHYSHQFRLGVAPERAAELVAAGAAVSVLVPYGPDWATYMSRRITLNVSAVGQVARAAMGRGAHS